MFLVDRLWPRGVAKDSLPLDGWLKDVAPSDQLRRWFGHDPDRFEEFARRYRAELDRAYDSESSQLHELVEQARSRDVVLLFAAKDTEHNQAVVLAQWLRDRT